MLQQQLLTNQSVLNLAAPILKFCDFKCTLQVIVKIYVCYICQFHEHASWKMVHVKTM